MKFWCVMIGPRCATRVHAIIVFDQCSAIMLLFEECAAPMHYILVLDQCTAVAMHVTCVLFDDSAAAMPAILVLDDRPARM